MGLQAWVSRSHSNYLKNAPPKEGHTRAHFNNPFNNNNNNNRPDSSTERQVENVGAEKNPKGEREILQMEDCYEELGFGFPTWKKWTILTVIFLVQGEHSGTRGLRDICIDFNQYR